MTYDELIDVIPPKPSLLRRLFPWLPIVYVNKKLRLFTFLLADCSHVAYPMTKTHFIDVLRESSLIGKGKWKGFQLWY